MKRLSYIGLMVLLLAGNAQAVVYLRQSTAATIKIQMVDVTDGHTPETGLTIDDTHVQLMKAWGAWASKSDTTDPAHVASGWYSCVLNTTDTGTVGPLHLRVASQNTARIPDANALEFEVVTADWYDLMTGAASFMSTAATQNAVRVELEKAIDDDPNAASIAAYVKTMGGTGVNVSSINSVATTSVTTVNAYVGMTQPVNFTGTGASAKVKADVITVEGTDATDTLGTAQTGDAFARLGAPAGASVSADIAAVKAQTAAIEVDTQDLQTQIGVDGVGLTVITDLLDEIINDWLANGVY